MTKFEALVLKSLLVILTSLVLQLNRDIEDAVYKLTADISKYVNNS